MPVKKDKILYYYINEYEEKECVNEIIWIKEKKWEIKIWRNWIERRRDKGRSRKDRIKRNL